MSERNGLLLGIVGLLAAVAGLWLLALAPKREQAAVLATRVAIAEQSRDAAIARAATADRARLTYARDYATVARLGKAVPASADVPSLVYQLETAARRAKVDFRGVSVLDSTPEPSTTPAAGAAPGGGIEPAPFSFRFEGSFFGLQKLLAAIDELSRVKGTQVSVNGRLLTIDGLTLNPGRGGLPRIQGVVTARAYLAELPDVLPNAGVQSASAGLPAPTAIPASEVKP